MRRILKAFLSTTFVALLSVPSLGQNSVVLPDYYVYANNTISLYLTPFSLDGAQFNPSCYIHAGTNGQFVQLTSYAIGTYSCGGKYWAADPRSGALYTETSLGKFNYAWIHQGTLNIAGSTSGGTLSPVLTVGAYMPFDLLWGDKLTVTGPPIGTPVALRVTSTLYDGKLSGITPGSELDAVTELVPYINSGYSCQLGQVREASFQYNFRSSVPSISSQKQSDVCTYSGAVLDLYSEVYGQFLGQNNDWNKVFALNSSVNVDSLTPGVQLISASHTNYATPDFKIPASGTGCNGTFTGIFQGNLDISAGQTCVLSGGSVTGNITQTGGRLILRNATVGGNVAINGGTFVIGPFTTVNGSLNIQNISDQKVANQVCTTNIKGNLTINDSGASVLIGSASPPCGGNNIGGYLLAKYNTGPVTIYSDSVAGNLVVQHDTSITSVSNNEVGNSLVLQYNDGQTRVTNNTVARYLQCAANSSIAGKGNKALAETGQCAKF